jgi:predicted transcriptional regulator YheO
VESIKEESGFFRQLLNLLAEEFGDKCEVVLHDLTGDYGHTIVDIRHGAVTGREVGGSGTNLGLEVLAGKVKDGDRFNYITTTKDGKLLRSSTIYIKNSAGKPVGSLCVNLDITDSVKFERALHEHNNFSPSGGGEPMDEFFARDVGSLLDYMIGKIVLQFGKSPESLSKTERLEFIRALDEQGAFSITKANEKICKVLGVSKFTLYSDLEKIHQQSAATQDARDDKTA